jgi:hypothetical protein
MYSDLVLYLHSFAAFVLEWKEWSHSRSGCLTPTAPIWYESGWASAHLHTVEKRQIFAPTRNRTTILWNSFLSRLSYAGCWKYVCLLKIQNSKFKNSKFKTQNSALLQSAVGMFLDLRTSMVHVWFCNICDNTSLLLELLAFFYEDDW